MPRRPRNYLPGVPCHVIQRGNNRVACFHVDDDRKRYLEWLGAASRKYECSVHAYVLMDNHVHMLVTPQAETGISRMMQSLGRCFVRDMNWRYNRTGTLWEGRHKASLVDTERYFFICSRYIELNPVRAGMVADPADHAWSSFRANASGLPDPLISPHPLYTELGGSPNERQEAYRELFERELDQADIDAIRRAINLEIPIGSASFTNELERRLARPVSQAPVGRPRKGLLAFDWSRGVVEKAEPANSGTNFDE